MKKYLTAKAYWTGKTWKINVMREGQRKTFYCSTPGVKGKRECEEKAENWINMILDDDPKFSYAYEKWLASKEMSLSNSSYKSLVSITKHFATEELLPKRMSRITERKWQECLDKMTEKGKQKSSISKVKSILLEFLKYCYSSRWIERIPSSDDLKVNTHREGKKKDILQPDAVRKLFGIDWDTKHGKQEKCWYIHAFRFAVVMGLRRGEIAGLKWEDIQGDKLHINRSVNHICEITDCKNKNARRMIVLTEHAKKILEDQRDMVSKEGYISEWIFPSEINKVANPNRIYDCFMHFCMTHGLGENVDFHSLRRTMISINQMDLPEQMLKQVVGHSKTMDTYGIYGRKVDGDAEKASIIMGERFSSILSETMDK